MKRLCLALLFVFVTSAPSYAALSYTEAQIDTLLGIVNTGTTPGKAIFAGATYAAIMTLLGAAPLASPTFTGSVILPSDNADPAATAGSLVHDSTVAGLLTGALAWYDGDENRYIVDLDVLPSNDAYVVAYSAGDDKFYMKLDATGGGTTMVDDTMWANVGDIAYATGNDAGAVLSAGAEGTLLMGNGANPPSFLPAGTATYMLIAAGADDPVWSTPAAVRANLDLESGTDFIPKTGNGTWKVIYTDGSGTQTELALSATSGALLASQGVAAEPAFLTSLSGLTFGGFTASSHVYADGSGNLASAVIAGEEFIPVGWMDIVDGGTDPPTTTYSTATNSREIRIATFDGTTDEALTFLWMVPGNASGTTLKFKWHGIVLEAATAPSAKDISFSLDCVSVADGAQLDFATFDATATAATETVTEDKDDIIISAYSAAHTPTSMAAGEMMLCELIRDADGADTYAQDIGLVGITIKYAKNESTVTF